MVTSWREYDVGEEWVFVWVWAEGNTESNFRGGRGNTSSPRSRRKEENSMGPWANARYV